MRNALLGSLAALAVATPLVAAPGAEPPVSYGRDVRPILSENCFYCHGQDPNHRKADVRLDTEAGQRADGVVVPGKPAESELVRRVLSDDPAEQMPPPKSNRTLTAAQKDTLRRWVEQGAKFEGHWAFRAPVRPAVPKVAGVSNPVDAFIRARLAAQGLKPAPPADPRTLIRRVTLDLTGLPPTPEAVDAFVADPSPAAYANVVDALLASPQYGERMALPWLDAARYADSNGFQQDGDTFQWVWRDWVVKAINDNVPFDRFTVEQLAGDLLPNPTLDQKVATGFNRNHLVNGEGGAIAEEQRFNILFDRVDTTATTWLGLTMACAQCHDHKYDPMTQRDYYSLLAAFNNVSETGLAGRQTPKTRVSPPFIDAWTPDQRKTSEALDKVAASLRSALDEKRKLWEAKVAADPNFPDKAVREAVLATNTQDPGRRNRLIADYYAEKVDPELAKLQRREQATADAFKDELPRVMVMADDRPRPTHVLDRGEYLKPKEKVTTDVPGFLPPLPKDAPRNRLGLARWLVAPEHPLTARVAVNRAWQTVFGTGLVKTSEDFGVQGDVPVHPELLDWLAVEFRESGWDVKRLYRLLVTSETYKQSSQVRSAEFGTRNEQPGSAAVLGFAAITPRSAFRTPHLEDPENRLYARFPRVRLPAMTLRDVALAASGLLNPKVGGAPVYPYQPDGIWEPLAITKERDFTYPASSGPDLYRRSLYTFWRRTIGPANMFDASPRQTCKVKPFVTNTPLHALTTLNDPTWAEAARVLAANALKTAPDADARFAFVYRRVLARSPTEKERPVLRKMLAAQTEVYRSDPAAAKQAVAVGAAPVPAGADPVELAAWANVCLAVLNLDEALTRE